MEKLNEKQQGVEAVSTIEPELSEAAVQQIEQQLTKEESPVAEETTTVVEEETVQETKAEPAVEANVEASDETIAEATLEASVETTVEEKVETMEDPIVETIVEAQVETEVAPAEETTQTETQETTAESNTEPLLSSWTQTFHTANALQEELENWTLQVLEQQRALSEKALNQTKQQWEQLSRGLNTYIPQTQEFLKSNDFGGQDLWLHAQDQLESITKTWIEQNRQARQDMQSWLENSAAPFEQIGKMFYPFK